jgi:DNA polymerase-3 subunit delta
MLRIFYGPDTYSRTEAVRSLKRELDGDGMLSANTATLDGSKLSLAELRAICDTVPFLAAHRLVIVSDLLVRGQAQRPWGRSGRGQAEAGGADMLALAEYVPRMPPSTTLLLLDGAVRDDSPLLRALRPLGEVRVFRQLGPDETGEWIQRRARDLNARFEPRALRALVELAGGNLWGLAGEVDKLALYASGRPVTEADVRLMVAGAQESNIFAMVDAIVDGQPEPALRQLRLLLQGGAAGPYLITMIARAYRQLLLVEALTRSGASSEAISRAAEVRSEGLLRRLRQQARRWSPARLQRAYERILAADLSIKRGEADEDTALELLVGELASGAA